MEIKIENIKLIGFKENHYYMSNSGKFAINLTDSYQIRVEFFNDKYSIYLFSGDEFNLKYKLPLQIKNITDLKNVVEILTK